jgi:hypothetical protein
MLPAVPGVPQACCAVWCVCCWTHIAPAQCLLCKVQTNVQPAQTRTSNNCFVRHLLPLCLTTATTTNDTRRLQLCITKNTDGCGATVASVRAAHTTGAQTASKDQKPAPPMCLTCSLRVRAAQSMSHFASPSHPRCWPERRRQCIMQCPGHKLCGRRVVACCNGPVGCAC